MACPSTQKTVLPTTISSTPWSRLPISTGNFQAYKSQDYCFHHNNLLDFIFTWKPIQASPTRKCDPTLMRRYQFICVCVFGRKRRGMEAKDNVSACQRRKWRRGRRRRWAPQPSNKKKNERKKNKLDNRKFLIWNARWPQPPVLPIHQHQNRPENNHNLFHLDSCWENNGATAWRREGKWKADHDPPRLDYSWTRLLSIPLSLSHSIFLNDNF